MYLCTNRNNNFDIILLFYSNIIITVNRSGKTGKTFGVPTIDSSYGGTYTCLVTVSSATSEESSGVKMTATGIPILFYCTRKYYMYFYLPKTKKFGCVGGET